MCAVRHHLVFSLLTTCLGALTLAGGHAAAQEWTVDGAASSAWADGEVYADRGCDNDPVAGGPPPVCPAPPPGLAALMAPPPELCFQQPLGTCPPGLGPCDFLHAFVLPPWTVDAMRECINGLSADFVFAGPTGYQIWDFGAYAAASALDDPPVDPLGFCTDPGWAESEGRSRILVEGVGTRTLEIRFGAEVDQDVQDAGEGFLTRGCMGVRATIVGEATGLPQSQSFIRTDHFIIGDADTGPDCRVPGIGPICAVHPLPPDEDFGRSSVFMSVDYGAGPFVLRDRLLDPYNPVNPTPDNVATPPWDYAVTAVPPSASSVPLQAVLRAESDLTMSWPPQSMLTDDDSEATAFSGQLWIYVISHDFDEPLDQHMRLVPVTGVGNEGPAYPFRMGRHEITNQQYANFLNSADLDAGQTGLGSGMFFDPTIGTVTTTDGVSTMFDPGVAGSRIVFTSGAPAGTRYTVARPVGADVRSYERHPVVGASWLGAVKFCNWLTLEAGLPPTQRCYSEGTSLADWHPMTISTADWIARDLDTQERQQLVGGYRGYRLPMDDLGTALGFVSTQPAAYNEWYKAAAHDPAAPVATRSDPGGALVPPYHWTFGFGRDLLLPGDANYFNSLDPFDNDDAFVGFYDGSVRNPGGGGTIGDGTQIQTAPLANPWAIYDLTGNVDEWVQDRTAAGMHFAVRGGSWATMAPECAATGRTSLPATTTDGRTGFRVVRSELPGAVTCWSEGFDHYQQGWLSGQGGWEPWNGDPQAAGFTVGPGVASSAPYAVETDDVDDAVRRFSGLGGSGVHRFHARIRVPLAMNDEQNLILLNAYPATALHDWSLQLALDGQNDVLSDHNAPAANLPLVRDSWADLRVVIDLGQDEQRVFYDGQPLLQKAWTSGVTPGGALDIGAVDLWANGSAYGVRYDDLRLDTCVSDIDGSGQVDIDDVIAVILEWGCAGLCLGDVTLDGVVGVDDLVQVIIDYGPCDC